MPHICVLYASEDQSFAHQLAVQLRQRGLVVYPVPEPPPPGVPDNPALSPSAGLTNASHALIIVSTEGLASGMLEPLWEQAQRTVPRLIILPRSDHLDLPANLSNHAKVKFDGPFLLAFEDLVRRLEKSKAPTRPLTVESPPPVSHSDLLPIKLPSERCWREDRLRINYNLPIIISLHDLALRSPLFFQAAGFEVVRESKKAIRVRRAQKYSWFDPRRTQHTLTLRPRRGRLQIHYRMARTEVWHWFPAHYRVLDREAAALYRYLVTGQIDFEVTEPIWRQARRAQAVSWAALMLIPLVLAAIVYLIAI